MSKSTFVSTAISAGVIASYSGTENTMFVKGEDKAVKTFIRKCNLKGKAAFPFAVKQS
jgi:hypothetical protein